MNIKALKQSNKYTEEINIWVTLKLMCGAKSLSRSLRLRAKIKKSGQFMKQKQKSHFADENKIKQKMRCL